jgi:hypothetical protein
MTCSQKEKGGAAGGGAGRSWAWGDGGVDIRGAYAEPRTLDDCGRSDRTGR